MRKKKQHRSTQDRDMRRRRRVSQQDALVVDRALTPAARRLANINAKRTSAGRDEHLQLDRGSAFSRVAQHQVEAYAAGTITTHLPKSKAHRIGSARS